MPRYRYEARTAEGEEVRGVIEAGSPREAERSLAHQGHRAIAVEPEAPAPRDRLLAAVHRRVVQPILAPVNSKHLAQFFTSLRVLLSAGMTMVEAMNHLARQTPSRALRRVAAEAAAAATQGVPLSRVLRRYPGAFSPATLAAVEAAEQSGMMEATAGLLARYYDRAREIELTYRWQTFYPKLLVICAVLIPTVPTLVLSSVKAWLSLVWQRSVPVLAGIAGLWYGWRILVRLPGVGRAVDRVRILIPWFGSLSRRVSCARWARTLSMLLAAGVPVHRALVVAAGATGNRAMEAALAREAEGVLRGRSLSEVIRASREIPEAAVDLITVAERSGSTESALDKVAEYYEAETEVGGKQTAVAVGVFAYLVIAAIIGFVVIRTWGGYLAGVESAIERGGF